MTYRNRIPELEKRMTRYKPPKSEFEKLIETHFEEFPDIPFNLPSEEAKGYGFELPENYQLEARQEAGGLKYYQVPTEEFRLEIESAQAEYNQWKTEFESTGWAVTDEGLLQSPEGLLYTPEELEAKQQEKIKQFEQKTLPYLPEDLQAKYQTLPLEDFWTEYEAWAIPQEQKRQEFIDTIAAVFPDVAEGGQETINDWIVKLNTDVGQEDILARLTAKGRSPETENLLTAIGATPEQIDELFQYVEGLAYEPSAGEVATPKEPLVAEVTNVRTGEVIPQSELKARYPKGYEAELDQWVLTPETAKRLPSVISVFGQSLARVPKQLAAAILTAIQPMGASVVDRDWADRKILEATTDQAKFVAEVSEKYKSSGLPVDITDIASLPQNIAYSLTSMGAGLGVGVGVGILPIPGARVAAWVAGTAASGAVAYNMTHYQIVQQYLEAKNDEKIASGKGTLTQDEEDALKAEFESLARQYGLWEAVPEAISNLAFAKLLTAPLGRMVGKSIATRVIGKLAGMYGEELLTETITQKGQSAIEVEVGLRENKITWIEAFKEVAPQTFLLTTLMAGAGQVSISGLTRIRESLQNEIGDKKSLHDIIKNGLVTLVNDETGSIELPGGEQIPPKPEVAKPYNWRQAFNETNDPSRKADILRAVAEVTTVTPKELQDILERVTGLPDEANIRYAVERRQQAIPKAETGMPEAGVQAGAFGVSAKEVRPQGKGKITQISMDEQLKLEQMRKEAETPEDIQNVKAYEKQVQIEGLKDYLKSEPASALTNLAKKLGWYKGEVNNLTLKQYRDLTGKREILPNILTSDKKHVRWEYALDEIATEYGYPDGDALKEAIEQSRETELQIADIEKELIAMPLPEPPVKATTLSRGFYKYLVERDVTDLPVKDVDLWMELFGDALVSEDILKQRAATLELRKIEQAKRAANAEDILQEEYLKTGNLEEAAAKARDIALRGELPKVTSDILSIITEDVRAILFAKIRFHWTQVESEYSFYEENSAIEALTHALDTGDIPRKRGTGTPWFPKGGSQWDRLARVFGKESPVLKALDEGKKPIDDIVDGVFHEIGRDPVPIDQEAAAYLRSLPSVPMGQAELLAWKKKWQSPTIEDVRAAQEKEFALTELNLGTALAEGRITQDMYDIEMAIARNKVHPYAPVSKSEPVIEKEWKQYPLIPRPFKEKFIRVLKEIGWSPIDIGNFLRANKASVDFSFWRQQSPMMLASPVKFMRANLEAFRAIPSQRSAEANWEWIKRHKYQEYYEAAELDFLRPLELEKGTSQYKGVEEFGYAGGERTISRLTAKIPWVKLSARVFVTGTNTHNWLNFIDIVDSILADRDAMARGEMKSPRDGFDVVKEIRAQGKVIEDLTGRASLGKFSVAAPALSSLIFAPRLAIARAIAPRHLVSSNPRVRKLAWKNMSTFVVGMSAPILLGWMAGWWDVERDPRSAEFMSIRIGKVRIDPWGGYRQFLVFYTRVIEGTGISSVTGAEYEADPIRTLYNFLHSKASPLASIILDFWTGKTFIGDDVDITNKQQWVEQLTPFALQDIWDTYSEQNWESAVGVAIPAILGAGVQTYTGDWEENFTKLGLPKFYENLIYGLDEPAYTTKDFWADTASQFKGVDPATLTDKKGYPNYIRGMVEAARIRDMMGDMPNQTLYSINADPDKGVTITQYRQMWIDREKLVAQGDDASYTIVETMPNGEKKSTTYTGKDAVTAFDNDERTKSARLGNITQKQYALLVEYHSTTDPKAQANFLREHPEIAANPRKDYLKNHPKENAQLAVWGQADILTRQAYDEFKRLLVEYDIPDSAIPELTLPPEGSIDTHFKYLDMVADEVETGMQAKLLLLQDYLAAQEADTKSYVIWKGLTIPDETVEYYQMRVDNSELFDKFDAISKDDTLTDEQKNEARAELRANKVGSETFHDIERRVDAMGKGDRTNPISQEIVDSHVAYMRILDQTDIKFQEAEANLYRIDNPDYNQSRLDKDLWGTGAFNQDIDLTQEPKWRLQIQYRDEFTEYDTSIPQKYSSMADDDVTALDTPQGYNPAWWATQSVESKRRILEGIDREAMMVDNPQFMEDKRRVEAYEKGIPQVEEWVEYNSLPLSGYRRDRYLVEHPDFAQAYHNLDTGHDIPSAQDIPSIRYDEITEQYQEQFGLKDSYGNIKSENYIEDTVERQVAVDALRYTPDPRYKKGVLNDFGRAIIMQNGYKDFIPDKYINRYTDWMALTEYQGVPLDWPKNKEGTQLDWYEDEWYLKEHPAFYEDVYCTILRDFTPKDRAEEDARLEAAPSEDVFIMFAKYVLMNSKEQERFRRDNRDLDVWGQSEFGWQPIEDKKLKTGYSPLERAMEEASKQERAITR